MAEEKSPLKWKFKTGKGVTSSPAVVDGVVYFGSDDNHLYAVDIEKYSEMLAPIKVNGDLSQKNIKSKDTLNKTAPTDKKFITCYHDDLFYEDIGDNFQREDTIVVLENLGDVYEFAEIENREEARDFYNSQITSNFFELGYTDYGNWEELETIVGEEELKALRKTYFDCDDFAETTWTILLYHDNKFVTILRD